MITIYPVDKKSNDNSITCFLGGGITNCYDWQAEVISELSKKSIDNLVLFNPRRPSFDITDKNSTNEQILWEFTNLNSCDIFSMYFVNSDSIQPICLYELGRYIEVFKNKYPDSYDKRICISVESGYKRELDVIIQSGLAMNKPDIVNSMATPESHANLIYSCYKSLHDNYTF